MVLDNSLGSERLGNWFGTGAAFFEFSNKQGIFYHLHGYVLNITVFQRFLQERQHMLITLNRPHRRLRYLHLFLTPGKEPFQCLIQRIMFF